MPIFGNTAQAHWEEFLASTKQLMSKKLAARRKVFISYAWEPDKKANGLLQNRLIQFRDDLLAAGCDSVFLDVSAMSGSIEETMARELAQSNIVLAICTPQFKKRAKDPKTNVGYEFQRTLEKIKNNPSAVYPVWLTGSVKEAIPDDFNNLRVYDHRDPLRHTLQLGIALLPNILDLDAVEYQLLWQTYYSSAFSQGEPGLLNRLAALNPSNTKKMAHLELPVIKLADGQSHTITDWLKHSNSITMILEERSNDRSIYWTEILKTMWQDSLVTGLVPLYLPLESVAQQSNNILQDWLSSQGFNLAEINALQYHYSFLLIASGYEHRINLMRYSLVHDLDWASWRGKLHILCSSVYQQEAKFIDDYLKEKQLPACQSVQLSYPMIDNAVIEKMMSVPALSSKPEHCVQVTPIQVQLTASSITLTESQKYQYWQMFLTNQVRILFTKHSVYLSTAALTANLEKRIDLLKNSLQLAGFTLISDLTAADSILVIVTRSYAAAVNKKSQADYAAVVQRLSEKSHTVYPLCYEGKNIIENVPSALSKQLIRDCRDANEDYWNLGAIENPWGLFPSLLGLRLDDPKGKNYQAEWQTFCQTVWGEAGRPSGLITRLKVVSQQQLKQESLYQQTKAYYQEPGLSKTKNTDSSQDFGRYQKQLLLEAQKVTDHRVFALLGESGTGKSMNLFRLEEMLWNEYHQYHLIPLRVNLSQAKPGSDVIVDRLTQIGYSAHEIQQLRTQHRFLILFDGYDEFVFQHGKHNVLQDSAVKNWPGVTLISCRIAVEAELMSMNLDSWDYLCPFSPQKIDAYLAKQAKDHKELTQEVRDKVHTLPGLIDLIANPLLLYIAANILPELVQAQKAERQVLTRYRLYELFTEKWFQREFVRVVEEGSLRHLQQNNFRGTWQAALRYYAEQVAVTLYQKGILQVNAQELDETAQDYLKRLLIDGDDNQAVAVLRKACPLKELAPGQYGFVHQSFLEFMVADYLRQAIEEDDKNSVEKWGLRCLTQLSSLPEVMYFYAERLHYHPDYGKKEKIIERLYDFISGSKASEVATTINAASNAISVLNFALISLKRKALTEPAFFKGIRIPYAWLQTAELSEIDFTGSDLSYVVLAGTNLNGTIFDMCNLTGIDLQEFPLLAFKNQIRGMSVCADRKKLAVGQKGQVYFYRYDQARWILDDDCIEIGHLIKQIAFSPSGENLAVLCAHDQSEDYFQLRMINIKTKTNKMLFKADEDVIPLFTFSPCGNYFASTFVKKKIKINLTQYLVEAVNVYSFDRQGNVINKPRVLKCDGLSEILKDLGAISFSPDSDFMAIGCGSHILLLKLDGSVSKLAITHKIHDDEVVEICSIGFSPSGKHIACGLLNGDTAYLSTDGSGLLKFPAHTKAVSGIIFSPSGEQIISTSHDGTLRIWNTEGKEQQTFDIDDRLENLAFLALPSGNCILSQGTRSLRFLKTGFIKSPMFVGHASQVNTTAFAPSGRWVVSGGDDCSVRLWDFDHSVSMIFTGHTKRVAVVSFSPSEKQIVSAGDDAIRIWNMNGSAGPVLTGPTQDIIHLALSPSGKQVVSISKEKFKSTLFINEDDSSEESNKSICIWNVDDSSLSLLKTNRLNEAIERIEFNVSENQLVIHYRNERQNLCWNIDAKTNLIKQTKPILREKKSTLAKENYPVIEIIDGYNTYEAIEKNFVQASLKVNRYLIRQYVFSPDRNEFVSQGYDQTIRLWSVKTKKNTLLTKFGLNIKKIEFSSSGNRLLLWKKDQSKFTLWEKHQGKWVRMLSHPNAVKILEADQASFNDVQSLPRDCQELFLQLGALVPKDAVSLPFCFDAAQMGDRDAQYELAEHYRLTSNYRTAEKWYAKAALQGHPVLSILHQRSGKERLYNIMCHQFCCAELNPPDQALTKMFQGFNQELLKETLACFLPRLLCFPFQASFVPIVLPYHNARSEKNIKCQSLYCLSCCCMYAMAVECTSWIILSCINEGLCSIPYLSPYSQEFKEVTSVRNDGEIRINASEIEPDDIMKRSLGFFCNPEVKSQWIELRPFPEPIIDNSSLISAQPVAIELLPEAHSDNPIVSQPGRLTSPSVFFKQAFPEDRRDSVGSNSIHSDDFAMEEQPFAETGSSFTQLGGAKFV